MHFLLISSQCARLLNVTRRVPALRLGTASKRR